MHAEDDEDAIQNAAAITRNDSPSAARPIPVERSASELYEEDLEGGPGSVPEERRGGSLWRRMGSSVGNVVGGLFASVQGEGRRGGRELDRDR
ncbi:MAG: hypothetical protein INR71_00875 [Terriglobus roseus]|nr:hypothetical protein [Terriglobus roseus]